jgi:hypothetical protein
MHCKMKLKITSMVLFGICLSAATAVADENFIVPGEFSLADAGSSDNAPLGATEQHFQQVFAGSLLTDLSVGDLINGIGFRVNGGESELPAQTILNYEISLSQSPNSPGNLSATFANNRGSDFQTVRSGPLTINAGDFPGGNSPNDIGWLMFSTPYAYQGGDLLIEVAFEGFTSGRNADAAYPYTLNLAQTAFGTGYNSTTADAGLYNEAIVMGLSTTSSIAPVPEPSASLLFAAGCFLLIIKRPWQRRGLIDPRRSYVSQL